MVLMKSGPKGKEYLYLLEYGHDNTGKRIKTTVDSFGKISSIPKEELNAIYAQYQQPVQERKLAQKIVHEKSGQSFFLCGQGPKPLPSVI